MGGSDRGSFLCDDRGWLGLCQVDGVSPPLFDSKPYDLDGVLVWPDRGAVSTLTQNNNARAMGYSAPYFSAFDWAIRRSQFGRGEILAQAASCPGIRRTHVVGDYYRVWDAVFYSRIVKDRVLWGITRRSKVTRDLWDLSRFKDPRVCYWTDDKEEAQKYLKKYNLENLIPLGESH